jgi:hypothetical protein
MNFCWGWSLREGENLMSGDTEFKTVRCETCACLLRVGGGEILIIDDGSELRFCGDGCMSAWLMNQ